MTKVHPRLFVLGAIIALAVLAAYANHFQNSFHFDDGHTVVQNPAIRSLANIPRFFWDPRLFSVQPTHYSYRPVVSASLAIDYWLAGGLRPVLFHISTFLWFLVQLALMYVLFARIFGGEIYLALFGVALYGLHPANAETVNYIVQRGDVYSTLGVVAGLVVYAEFPQWRRYGLYLIPALLGMLAKPPAVVFAPILLAYILLFEDGANRIRAAVPAFMLCVADLVFDRFMTPKSFVASNTPFLKYWITQPYVALRYFRSFFLPVHLSADSDLGPFQTLRDPRVWLGCAFCAVVIALASIAGRRREWRPVAFGLWWFLIGLVPTAVLPLAEVENDHRMYLPFVGLSLAAAWTGGMLVRRLRIPVAVTGCTIVVLLATCAWGTRQRNAVWRDEETLWLDVTLKSPRNGRGLMNYGVTQIGKGNLMGAYNYFEWAMQYLPDYSILEINLGVVSGAMHRDAEAMRHFERAILLAPNDAQSYTFYGRWLEASGRTGEAIVRLQKAASLNPADLDSRNLLMAIYAKQANWPALAAVSADVLRLAPDDEVAHRYHAMAGNPTDMDNAERIARAQPTPENYFNLSLAYHRIGRFEDCIRAAHDALRLRPDFAEAYNNIAAAYESLSEWDEAIEAAEEAVRLKPDFQLAKNNLAWAKAQKEKSAR